ncbi:hypothetical protein CFOL_v3_27448 [Cephalotus follicularis]|uniref:UBA domain-containing protein n=1 Tax=Cephalotus follicularis TaxID=3775 RepID=A0A1Q3CVC0_CEPFO|nr:hypothetical protein CFOL_v3_27448 [Cephalotus follicularis]
MLTLEGREVARECLIRSCLADTAVNLADDRVSDLEFARLSSAREVALPSVGMSGQKKSIDVPPESLERFTRMGYSKEQVRHAFSEVLETSQNKDISSLWPTVLCRLQEDQVYGSQSESLSLMENCLGTSTTNTFTSEVNPIGRQNNLMDSARYGG